MKSLITYIFEKQNPFNVWVMCGLPGSGKSTYIKEELPKNIEVINQDSIRVELGIMDNVEEKKLGNKEQENEVTRICLERIDKAIKERKDFVIDNTNIKICRVQNYYDKLKKANANIQIIIIDTPKEICKERRKEHIPEKVIDDMQIGLDEVKEKFKNNKDTKIISDRY